MYRPAREHALFVNAVQKWLVENTRLGIPAMFHEEALHGLTAPRRHALSRADRAGEHVGFAAHRAAHERGGARGARARGTQEGSRRSSTSAAIALGPHRGNLRRRSVPVTRMGVAAVRGYQGTPPLGDDKVFATFKHFAAHGPHESRQQTGRRSSRSGSCARSFRPFEVAVQGAGVSVMPRTTRWTASPSHASPGSSRKCCEGMGIRGSRRLGLLRVESTGRGTASRRQGGPPAAVGAGVDSAPGSPLLPSWWGSSKTDRVADPLTTDRLRGCSTLNSSPGCSRPLCRPDRAERGTNIAEHQALALEAARKTIALLKNDRAVSRSTRRK